jgi:hypothetical protein
MEMEDIVVTLFVGKGIEYQYFFFEKMKNSKYTKKISEMEEDLSFSVFLLIMEMKSRIGLIYKIPTAYSTRFPVIISPSPPPRILGLNPPFTPNK